MGTQLVSPTKVRTNDMSASVAAAAIGAGLSLTGGLFSNRTNRKIAEQNMALQREANQQNIDLTREINNQNIAFQQRENDITRMREDNAVQRAAADMTAAGLSKTLAAGNPASASALSAPQASTPQVSPVQNSFRYESALQKMNIANLMLDIATKNESLKQAKALNDAQIANIQANTDNTNLQNSVFLDQHIHKIQLEDSQIALNYSNKELNDAKTELEKITSSKQADLIQSEIDRNVAVYLLNMSQKNLTDKELQKKSFEIANEIANYNYLTEKQREVVAEIAYKEMQTNVLKQNLDVAKKYGYPVGYMPSGIWGGAFSTAAGIAGLANFKFNSSGNLNLTPYEQMVLGMSGNVGTYLPPVT